MILGSYSPSIYFKISSLTITFTLITIYWISQYYAHDKPFPHSSISSVAKHFPEYIFFRTTTISGSVLVILGWLTNHFYLQTIGVQKKIDLTPYKLQVMLTIGIVGSGALMASTALIDSGKENVHLHMKCAETFFLMTILAQLYNTVVYAVIAYKYKAVRQGLVVAKLVIAFLFIVQIILSSQKSLFSTFINEASFQPQSEDIASSKGNFYEWTIAFTISAGFYVMSLDVEKFRYVYEQYKEIEDNGSMSTQEVQMGQVYLR